MAKTDSETLGCENGRIDSIAIDAPKHQPARMVMASIPPAGPSNPMPTFALSEYTKSHINPLDMIVLAVIIGTRHGIAFIREV